jgi:hypothetical protein
MTTDPQTIGGGQRRGRGSLGTSLRMIGMSLALELLLALPAAASVQAQGDPGQRQSGRRLHRGPAPRPHLRDQHRAADRPAGPEPRQCVKVAPAFLRPLNGVTHAQISKEFSQ